ncbi:MAG: hypothetical protein CVT67_04495 [Actinobacteria bacterium HGW-Actinobacteria-7]|nr:MAG: hypothetical protein CVT67_04495 [Actinobacteria bacterium HGW-Actinobacteria-7]
MMIEEGPLMSKKMMAAVVAGLVSAMLLGGAGIASAGGRLQTRDRDQLRDGSCQVSVAKLQTRDRDQLRDGSCLAVTQSGTQTRARIKANECTPAVAPAASQTRDRDRLHDGSCSLIAKLQTRDRAQDGSCLIVGTKLQTRTRDC